GLLTPSPVTLERLADGKFRRQPGGFVGWQVDDGAILEQNAVQFAPWPVQLHLDVTVRLQHLVRAARAGWPGVGNRIAGGVIGHRHRLDQCDLPRLQPPYRDLIARLDGENELRSEMRREMHLGAVVQDQAVNLAARCQAVLDDPAVDRWELIRIGAPQPLSECACY